MKENKSLLRTEDIAILQSFDEGSSGWFFQMLDYLQKFIESGVEEGRFTEQEAHEDLEIALWYAFACNNIDDYEHYYMATQWMPDSEKNAEGCGAWYYRYSAALMYCGKLDAALEYSEAGVKEEPDYPWGWLQLGKLRSHFGDREGALEAVGRGLELEPGNYEFLTLQKEILEGRSLEEMAYHHIDPGFDRELQEGRGEDTINKQIAVAGIVCDEEGLAQVKELFQFTSWQADSPYCVGQSMIRGQNVTLVFRMNEATLSKMNLEWLRTQKESLEETGLIRTDDNGEVSLPEAVLFDRDYSVTPVYPKEESKEPLDEADAMDYILHYVLHEQMGTEDLVEGDHIYCPRWQMSVRPEIAQVLENGVVMNFYLSAPQWGRELFECAVGMGDSLKQAIGMACASFLFSFMQGIGKMEQGEESETLETVFANRTHCWEVYLSDIVGIGESAGMEKPEAYWELLKDEIMKRLGNQKLCYVKIYGAKSIGQVTGECRIDDIKSEELSRLVAGLVEKWDVEQFASQKVFFFIRQKEETTLPNVYSGQEGFELLKSRIKTAVELFHSCETEEQYDLLTGKLEQALKDATLAAECFAFLPEICAENAFEELVCPETVDIKIGEEEPVTCYKNQLADYWPMHHALFSLFEKGAFGDETNDIYGEYIGVSSLGNLMTQMEEKGVEMEDRKVSSMCFCVEPGFEIR